MKKLNVLAGAARLAAAAVIGIAVFTSCNKDLNTDEGVKVNRVASPKETTPTDPDRKVGYDIKNFSCSPSESSFTQTMTSEVYFTVNGEIEKSFDEVIKADCSLKAQKDTVSRMDMSADNNGVVSLKGNNAVVTYPDGQVLDLVFNTKAQYISYLGTSYRHGYDSVTAVRPLAVKYEVKGTSRAAAYVVKNLHKTGYPVEVTTTQFYGNSEVYQTHKDTLVVYGVTKELDKNDSNTSITDDGEEVLNEEQQKDSVVVTTTWDDGTTERNSYSTITNRWLKGIERRIIDVNSFDEKIYDDGFGKPEILSEKVVREDDLWTVKGREMRLKKAVAVDGHYEEVVYTYYEECAKFHMNGMEKVFDYVDWKIYNYEDNFKVEAISDRDGYDKLSYKNIIRTDYLGYIQVAEEDIDWYKEQVTVVKYEVAEAYRDDDSDAFFTLVGLNKIAIYSDGTSEVVEKVNHKFPKSVAPLTNWVINTDVWGVYTSGEFEVSLGNKTAKSEDKFSFNEYTYNFSNEVSGQTNKGQAVVVNDIVYDDGDIRYEFANTELVVNKENEGTAFVGENEEKSTYSYACLAKVAFGASQTVTLPGTVNIAKPQQPQQPQEPETHLHGKVVATYCTSTPNENRSFWYNVAVIAFEDGYKMVGMADNNAMEFNFNMSSTAANINSAVCVNGSYVPAFAKDDSSSMKWYDEAGNKRVVLDYISATASAWNNGHNTIWDVRREGRISEDGYSVTFYLNGLAGTTMRF